MVISVFFFFQAEDGIRDPLVTGVQTCALPIFRGVHGLDHVLRELANAIVDLIDLFTFGAQNRIAVLQDRQSHFSSRINDGRFFTPASFKASITLTIAPHDAFLSACRASVDLRSAGKSRTAVSSSSTPTACPSSW